MENKDLRKVRGLSIAILVISILSIIASFCIAGFVTLATNLAATEVTDGSIMELLQDDFYDYEDKNNYEQFLDSDDVKAGTDFAASTINIIVWTVCIFVVILSIFQLIAAAIGMGVVKKPQNAGKAFGWGIAGIILAFFSNIVNFILFIISVVYANKARKQISAENAPNELISNQ